MTTPSDDLQEKQARWDAAHATPRFRPRYPHEQLVRWAFRNLALGATPPTRVLDMGCGAGRHALFFAAEGMESHACDISRSGLAELDKVARERRLTVHTHHTSGHDLSFYPDAAFDAVASFAVLYYMTLEQAKQALSEVARVLRPGGKFFCVLRTDRDSRRDGAAAAGPCTWTLPALPAGAPSDMESGMRMLFFSRQDIEDLFSGFDKLQIDRMSYAQDDFVDDDWVITAAKSDT